MALSVAKGSFTAPTVAGTDTVLTMSAGFDPKAIILWTSGQTAEGLGLGGRFSVGYGTYAGSAVQQGYNHVHSVDNAASSAVSGGCNTIGVLRLNSGDNVIDCRCDLVSIVGQVITLDWFDAPATAILVHYLVLGGSDITAARVFSYIDDGVSPQAVTVAAGFGQPDLILTSTGQATTATDSASQSTISLMGGFDATNRAMSNWRLIDAQATMGVAVIQQAKFTAHNTASAFIETAELDAKASWPVDGFQVVKTITTARSDFHIGLALKGTFQKAIGAALVPTAGSLTQDIAAGFAPAGALLWGNSVIAAATITTAGVDLGAWGIGGTDGTTEGWAALSEDDAATESTMGRDFITTKGIRMMIPNGAVLTAPTLKSEADTSFSGNNLRLTWAAFDTVAREFNYLILGSAAGAAAAQVPYTNPMPPLIAQ